jgi:hypothetical protein
MTKRVIALVAVAIGSTLLTPGSPAVAGGIFSRCDSCGHSSGCDSLGPDFQAHTPWEIGPFLDLPDPWYSAPLHWDMWRLQDAMGCSDSPFYFGGWLAAGYHSNTTRQSFSSSDVLAYNNDPHMLALHQAWLYMGKIADGSCGFDWGFRADVMYGTDAPGLQANGRNAGLTPESGNWDASLDHGVYGWAIPQMYAEVAYGNLSVLGGYFMTPVGYESSLAPERFFYSRSLTMYNSEPFTHTGVLAQYGLERATLYAGWTLGWDSAFRQQNGGSAFLGGFAVDLNDRMVFSYFLNAGDLGWRGDNGYNHSLVLKTNITDRLGHVVQSDYITHDNSYGFPGLEVEEYGINNYLFYTVNRKLTIGTRLEWWKSDGPTGDAQSYYEATFGANIRPHRNVTFRPEIRYDWTPGDTNFANNQNITPLVNPSYNQWTFGVDCVITF